MQASPSQGYLAWRDQLLEAIPNLNHDVLVEFTLYLAFEAHYNDLKVWRAVEEACYPILHHLTLTQICQLEWATTNIKPKHVNARLNTLLTKRALEALETTTSPHDIIDILQGFRSRSSVDMYKKIRTLLLAKKDKLFPYGPTTHSTIDTSSTSASTKSSGKSSKPTRETIKPLQ